MESSKQRKEIRGKYREARTIDYSVKHKASLLIMRIYTCVLMLYKGRRSRTHPVFHCLNSRVSLCFVNARLSFYY